ncbi:hypothetical protein [Blautia sp. AM47-4]|uniref:hypothetical protein n=1 Tax=Blautia sp. AM47-4 TaxID=2292979 RepID=UPI001FAB0521|nr:hypothetical protein [Blautia sp. AM47-4]
MILIEEMRIYILNTTRFYHEDFEEYPGAWFSCPVDFEEIRERLGVQSEEEIEIEDYELPFPLEGNTSSGKSTPFAGWYRKCRERPSIMKWM